MVVYYYLLSLQKIYRYPNNHNDLSLLHSDRILVVDWFRFALSYSSSYTMFDHFNLIKILQATYVFLLKRNNYHSSYWNWNMKENECFPSKIKKSLPPYKGRKRFYFAVPPLFINEISSFIPFIT